MRAPVHALILAAGRSTRTGAAHKLLATFDGEPLVRRSARSALASSAAGVVVVVGHREAEMRAALAGLPLRIVANPRFAEGLSTSLIAGFHAVPDDAAGVLVMLADQPLVTAADLDRLIAAFESEGHGSIIVAADEGELFNPVVISFAYRSEIMSLSGDFGARRIFACHGEAVRTVEIGRAARLDVDTPEALAEAGGLPER